MKLELNEKIEAMKNQTFGCEIEMNEITREDAAKAVAEYFGTRAWRNTNDFTYKSWSCEDRTGRIWKFMRDGSIVGPDEEKCEMVTPILRYEDMENLQEIVRLLRKKGAKSDPSRGCGVHIHIGANGHTPHTLRNLVNIMAAHENLLIASMGISENRLSTYCSTVDPRFLRRLNDEKPDTMQKLADVWYESQCCDGNRDAHYNHSRYHILNLHATFTKGTVEFRMFQFNEPCGEKQNGLHAGQLKAYIQLCLAVNAMAKYTAKACAKPHADARELSVRRMRSWLFQMGMVGDEFATARELYSGRCERYAVQHREAREAA